MIRTFPALEPRCAGFLAGILLLLALTGCSEPLSYADPHIVGTDDGEWLLVLQAVGYEPLEARTLLVQSPARDSGTWERMPLRDGAVIAAVRHHDSILLVYPNGTVMKRPDGEGAFTRLVSGRMSPPLLHAAVVAGQVLAVRHDPPNGMQVLRLAEDDWEERFANLPTVGTPALLRVVDFESAPLLFWRREIGGHPEPGLQAAYCKDGAWQSFSTPKPDPSWGFFAVTVHQGALYLLREPRAPIGALHTRLPLYRFGGDGWKEVAEGITLPTERQLTAGFGLAITSDSERLLAVRVDPGGAHIYRSEDSLGRRWRATESALSQSQGGALGSLLLAMLLLGSLLTILVTRSALQRLGQKAQRSARSVGPDGGTQAASTPTSTPAAVLGAMRTGRFASPVERGLAMIIDMLLLSPLPVLYWESAMDFTPSTMPPEGWRHLYYVWIAGHAVYGCIAEGIWGQTLGKRAMGIRVRSVRGGPVGNGQAFVRNALRFVDFWFIEVAGVAMPYLVAVLAMALTPLRQRVGDLLGGTLVRTYTPLPWRSVVLASASPRRRDLLKRLGLSFLVIPSQAEERVDSRLSPEENALQLARQKAEDVASRLTHDELVIAADTLVMLEEELLGKPESEAHAREMLQRLAGRTHAVLTGVVVLDRSTGQVIAQVERTDVTFRSLFDDEIEHYVASGAPIGKAGAYGIQDAGCTFIADVRGSATNVVGLPMELLQHMLKLVDA